jgi:hypothetical protein
MPSRRAYSIHRSYVFAALSAQPVKRTRIAPAMSEPVPFPLALDVLEEFAQEHDIHVRLERRKLGGGSVCVLTVDHRTRPFRGPGRPRATQSAAPSAQLERIRPESAAVSNQRLKGKTICKMAGKPDDPFQGVREDNLRFLRRLQETAMQDFDVSCTASSAARAKPPSDETMRERVSRETLEARERPKPPDYE